MSADEKMSLREPALFRHEAIPWFKEIASLHPEGHWDDEERSSQ
jgi:hypothetical protein